MILARALDRKEGRNCYYLVKLAVGTGLMHNAEMDHMEDYELELSYDVVRPFIVECNDDRTD